MPLHVDYGISPAIVFSNGSSDYTIWNSDGYKRGREQMCGSFPEMDHYGSSSLLHLSVYQLLDLFHGKQGLFISARKGGRWIDRTDIVGFYLRDCWGIWGHGLDPRSDFLLLPRIVEAGIVAF